MIKITKTDGNNIYYKCTCGTIGKCMIRPIDDSSTIIVNVSCAMCNVSERVKLLQENNVGTNNTNISWALVVSNEIV